MFEICSPKGVQHFQHYVLITSPCSVARPIIVDCQCSIHLEQISMDPGSNPGGGAIFIFTSAYALSIY